MPRAHEVALFERVEGAGKVRDTPAISVVITAYQRREYLKRAVDSVLNQTLDRAAYEIIVVKDFSDPNLDRLLASNGVQSIRESMTMGKALSLGIQRARGEIVSFLDDDDVFLPEKLSRVRVAFAENPRLGYLHNAFSVLDESSKSPSRAVMRSGTRALTIDPALFSGKRLPSRAHWLGFNLSSVSVRRDWVLSLLPKLEELETAPDGFFVVSALAFGVPSVFDPNVLTQYRYHQSTSHFPSSSGEMHVLHETEHMKKYVAALKVIQGMVKGTPMEELIRYDLVYWQLRHAIFNPKSPWKPRPSDIALFIRGGLKQSTVHPFYLLPAYLASRIVPGCVHALFRIWGMRFGGRRLT